VLAEPVLRAASAADAVVIAGVLEEVYAPFRSSFSPTALSENAETIKADPGRWLVADIAGELVGCVRHEDDEDNAYTFCFLAVRPAWRQRGIGSRLVDAVVDIAASSGRDRILIAVRLGLTDNVRFFEKRGFTLVGPFESPRHGLFVRDLELRP
jgi:N-acetylglutamate synthase-like GNAT family acetyltransferase